MQLLAAEALVLDVVDLHDYDRIVTFLTRHQGKKRGVARGARRKHSRFAGQLQPLAKVNVKWHQKEGRDLVRISSAEMIRSPEPLLGDLEGLLLGAYLRDHLIEFAQEDEPDDHFFRLLDATIEALLAGIDRQLVTRYFEAWILRLAGVFPPPHECPECGRPLRGRRAVLPIHAEGLVCSDCGGRAADPVPADVLEFLLRIGHQRLEQIAVTPPTLATLEKADKLNAAVRRRFLQHELRSYKVIRETMKSLEGSASSGGAEKTR